ncbi:MAG: fibronectin type III domain-containing protein [Gemmatimonadota bacterium]
MRLIFRVRCDLGSAFSGSVCGWARLTRGAITVAGLAAIVTAPLVAQRGGPVIRVQPAAPPAGLTATSSGSAVTLTWQPVPTTGATYLVLRTQDMGIPPTPIGAPIPVTSYADGAVAPGQTYYYQVAAIYPDGRRAASSMVMFAVPPAPSPPAAMTSANAGSSMRRAGATTPTPTAPPTTPSTPTTPTTPSTGPTLTVVTPTGPAPSGFAVTGTPLVASLSWGRAPGVSSFVVLRLDGPGGSPIQRSPAKFLAWQLKDTVPDPRVPYQYRLIANYANGTWGEAVASFTSPPLVNPTGFRATMTAPNTVMLAWNPAPGAAQYRIDGAGLPNTGRPVIGATTTTIAPVPQGTQSWHVTALYPGNFADYVNHPGVSVVNRTPPAHAPVWLTKSNGPGSSAETAAHYSALGVFARYDQYNPPPRVGYTNRTELGTVRQTHCYDSTGPKGGPALICISETPLAAMSKITIDAQGARFESFAWSQGAAGNGSYGSGAGPGWTRGATATFDSEGPKSVPHVCLACHGGRYDPTTGLVQGASLLPIDPGLVDLGGGQAKAEETIRQINAKILRSGPAPAVASYIAGLYGGMVDVPNTKATRNYVPPGWSTRPTLYLDFVKKNCAMCHLAVSRNLDFLTAGNLVSNKALVYAAVCTARSMPHAEVPFLNFWSSGTGLMYGPDQFAAALGFSSCP